MVALATGEPGRPVLHVSYRAVEHGRDRGRIGGIGAVGLEDDPAVGQLHQLRVSGQDPDQPGLHQREHGPDQPPQQGRLPGPGSACDQHVRPVEFDQPGQAVFATANRQRLQIGEVRDRRGRDEGGQGITADELKHHRPGLRRADPAQQCPESVRQVLRALSEVGRRLARDQPDVHPVDIPGGSDLTQHRQQDAA
jgi:hypothetical protein